jgi:hypothetical protein
MSASYWTSFVEWLDRGLKESVILANDCYEKFDSLFDYLSNTVFLEKPTFKLVIDELDMPIGDRNVVDSIIHFIHQLLGLAIAPIKNINDKKFIPQKFQSTNVFNMPGTVKNDLHFYDKLIIYIVKNSADIVEPSNKRINQMISIDGNDYNVPVALWYTFLLNKTKIYFYIHISTNGYKGVLVAIHKDDDGLIEELIQAVNNEYNKNPGKSSESDETIEDLLNKNKPKAAPAQKQEKVKDDDEILGGDDLYG